MAAVGMLARGWFRGRRGGWLGTSAVLAATLSLLVLVTALFAGMQSETEQRVGDVFTGELRVTPKDVGVFGPGRFDPAASEAAGLGATMRMESQSVLSRCFTCLVLSPDESVTVGGPGSGRDQESVSLGILVGADYRDPVVAKHYEGYLVRGSLPGPWAGEGTGAIPVAISLRTLDGLISNEDKASLSSWPPPMNEIKNFPLDITAGVARDGDYSNDVYRNQARIVGLFETGVETLDSFTVLGPIEAARFLLGYEPDEDIANVFIAPKESRAEAEANGWAVETRGAFTERYLGQLITALRTLSTVTASVLFTVPAFLVAHGVERVLEAQKREVAVLRAMGVPGRTIRSAMARLVLLTASIAVVAAGALIAIFGTALHGFLPNWDAAPLPLDVTFSFTSVIGSLIIAVGSTLVAYLIAIRGQRRVNVTSVLRAV